LHAKIALSFVKNVIEWQKIIAAAVTVHSQPAIRAGIGFEPHLLIVLIYS